jgi:EAL domain-containing protein
MPSECAFLARVVCANPSGSCDILGGMGASPGSSSGQEPSATRGTAQNGSSDAVPKRIALAHDLGIQVVAEGVETNTTWRQVADLGWEMVQGYALARPMPGDDLRI